MLLIILMVPLIGTLALILTRKKSLKIPFVTSLIVLILGEFGLKGVFSGAPLTYEVGMTGPFVLTLQADALSAIFVLLSAFIWLVVSIYLPKYMEYEGGAWGFDLCTVLALFAVLGMFLAGNLLTMLLFFELMSITSYFWVIHKWDKEAIRAGYFYLFFSIVGGLLLALGIVMMGSATAALPSIGSGMVTPLDPQLFHWSIVIFLIGFGIKAGMVPLHLWLPHAHSVAPTPGSALLSGLLIKVGAYGLIRVGEFAGWGVTLGSGVTWLGSALLIFGTCTMLLGVLAALIQSNAKKLLAYHSVSQMGYIILGLGAGLYLGADGGFGLSGAIYHIINHALFKVALFLGVGIIYIHTGETDLYKLGGLRRQFPVTALLMLVAALGITGAPGLNGYASKTLLHHGISQAAVTGAPWIIWIEGLFMLVGVGTATSFAKLYYLIFLGKPTQLEVKDGKSPMMKLAMGLLALLMLVIGIWPKLLLNLAIVPAAEALGMTAISTSLAGLSFWEVKGLFEMVLTLGLGMLVCWAGFKSGAFHWHPPLWLTIEGATGIIVGKMFVILEIVLGFYHSVLQSIQVAGRNMTSHLGLAFHKFDKSKSSRVWGTQLMGISADVAILVFVLGMLIACYTLMNFSFIA